ncbi:bifunctional polynucleotide phosphatase/kinase, putative (PNKP) [Plasmodium ovale wallikeri]|uniref:Bifunctional polynucleotide phosphatase/kinase, putative n=2 Tax=Plasmodium ovale TaxID=36330 RepID=A0A1C3KTN5_PLAOA|nr:bifunctional polynucleotide phosphatase/kinase, putative (PNKP) [Plasmodium ovale wallikeri]SBT77525.1 bifunctional polynucleotide phosphatase/kinase, putative [Plasmodium ovale]
MFKRYISHFEMPNSNWNIVEDSLLYRIVKDKEDKIYKKIFAFDLDNTLILSRSFFKPAQNENDYMFYTDIIDFLKKKRSEDYKIIIFSNQKGVSTGKISLLNIVNRVDDIIQKIGIPLECYLALKNDKYRKPRTGMYKFAEENNKCKIEEIIYVGDNANRIYDDNFKKQFINHLKYIYKKNKVNVNINEIEKRLKRDYTDTDLKFALNINATFYTPEELFLNIKNNLSAEFSFIPMNLLKNEDARGTVHKKNDFLNLLQQCALLPTQQMTQTSHTKKEGTAVLESGGESGTNGQFFIILIGAPGCGKTFLCDTYFPHFTKINIDSAKRKSINIVKEYIRSGKNVIIDGENAYTKNRIIYIYMAKQINKNLKVNAIFFNYSKDLVIHLNTFKLITDRSQRIHDIPTIAIQSFYKYVEKPTARENFDKIVILNDEDFVPRNFENDEQKKMFFSYLY